MSDLRCSGNNELTENEILQHINVVLLPGFSMKSASQKVLQIFYTILKLLEQYVYELLVKNESLWRKIIRSYRYRKYLTSQPM